jgi:hypothetical protein
MAPISYFLISLDLWQIIFMAELETRGMISIFAPTPADTPFDPDRKPLFGIDMNLPEDWWDTKKHPELWEGYVIPAFQQLRQQAASQAHGEKCECHICSGEIDEPVISYPDEAASREIPKHT